MKDNSSYDLKLVRKYLGWLLALVVAMMVTRGIAAVLFPILLVYYISKRRTEGLVHIIMLTTSVMMMNGTLAPLGTVSSIAVKGQMILAALLLAVSIFSQRQFGVLSPILGIMPYILFMIIPSARGWCPKVSFLKLFLFTAVFFAYYGCAFQAMSRGDKTRTYRSMILSVAIFFIFGSLLSYPIPSISMMDYQLAAQSGATSYYQGVTGHSQALGVVMAVFGGLLYADLVFNVQKADRLYIALIVCAFVLIYMSASRTAMASLVASVGLSTLLAMRARGIPLRWRGKVVNSMVMLVTLLSLVILVIPGTRNKAVKFAIKHGGADATMAESDVFMSRRATWEVAMYNWRKSPYIGNGFQVSWDMQAKKISGIKDVLSAPIEKGTWTTAILEEGGVIGMFLFVIFLIVVFSRWMQTGAYVGMSTFFVFLMCNFGEFSLFSMSMDGGIFWFLVFFGLILDHWRIQQRKMEQSGVLIKK